MNKKLKRFGIHLPSLPLTSVGSFPKTDKVKRMRKTLSPDDPTLREIEKEVTRFWIEAQENLGYHVLVHGEIERGDMVAYFGEMLGGFSKGDKEEPIRSFGNLYWPPPEIDERVHCRGPITVASWQYAASYTKNPLKGMITGPATIYDWSLDGFYSKRHEGVCDIARALRTEITSLMDAGARIIQIDEPSLAHTPEHFPTLLEAFKIMLENLTERAYFIMHTCYGEDVFERIYPQMLELPVDNLDLELANSDMSLLETIRQHPSEKDLSLGVVDVHYPEIESVELVTERIERAREIVPDDRLWLKPDCGLKTRTVDEAIAKLEVIAKARDQVLRS